MRILAFSTLYPNAAEPRHGIFIEHRVRNQLASGGVEVRVVAPIPWFPFESKRFGKYARYATPPRVTQRNGVPVYHPRYVVLPKRGMTVAPFLLAAASLSLLRSLIAGGYEFDVLDGYYLYPDGVAVAILGALLARPVVLHALGGDVNVLATYRVPRRMIRWAMSRAVAVSAVSNDLRTKLVGLGLPSAKAHVILHGVDHALFRPPSDRTTLRQTLGLDGLTLLSVGHLLEAKGHRIAIAALRELERAMLVIAGDGEDEAALRRLAADLQVADRVRFLGTVGQDQLRDYYGAADVVVLASRREGIPNVILESMACGTPVVATAVGGVPEVVTAPEAGVLMRDRSPEALAAAVVELLARRPDRDKTRQFSQRYSWAQTSADHLALLSRVVAATRQAY